MAYNARRLFYKIIASIICAVFFLTQVSYGYAFDNQMPDELRQNREKKHAVKGAKGKKIIKLSFALPHSFLNDFPISQATQKSARIIESKKALNDTALGLSEAGYSAKDIIRLLDKSHSLGDIIIALARCGISVEEIKSGLQKSGYTDEQINEAMPQKIAVYNKGKLQVKSSSAVQIQAKLRDQKTPIAQTSGNTANFTKQAIPVLEEKDTKVSSAQALRSLEAEGKIDSNTPEVLTEAGYSVKDIVKAYIAKAVDWVEEKVTAIVNCAAYALMGILGIEDNDVADITDIAISIIYADIIQTGQVTIKDGKIESSMCAIQSAASKHGVSLTGYKISSEDLINLKEKAIAHFGDTASGHWVVLTKIEGNETTILDNGKFKTISIDEFKSLASGNILTSEGLSQDKAITKGESLEIKGSGWGKPFRRLQKSIKKARKSIKSFMKSNIGRIVSAVIGAVLTVVTAGAFGAAFLAGWGAMGTAIAAGVGAFTSTLAVCTAGGMKLKHSLKAAVIAGVTAFACGFASGAISGKTIDPKLATKTDVMTAARDAAVSVGIDEGLKSTGNDNALSRIGASAVSKGVTADIDGQDFAEAVVTATAEQSIAEVSQANGWHDSVTQVLSTAAGSFSEKSIEDKKHAQKIAKIEKTQQLKQSKKQNNKRNYSGANKVIVENNIQDLPKSSPMINRLEEDYQRGYISKEGQFSNKIEIDKKIIVADIKSNEIKEQAIINKEKNNKLNLLEQFQQDPCSFIIKIYEKIGVLPTGSSIALGAGRELVSDLSQGVVKKADQWQEFAAKEMRSLQ